MNEDGLWKAVWAGIFNKSFNNRVVPAVFRACSALAPCVFDNTPHPA